MRDAKYSTQDTNANVVSMALVYNTTSRVAIVFTFTHTLGVECEWDFDGLPVWR